MNSITHHTVPCLADINDNLVKEKAMACSMRGGAHRFAIAVYFSPAKNKLKSKRSPFMCSSLSF
jgi:hypothetical protein